MGKLGHSCDTGFRYRLRPVTHIHPPTSSAAPQTASTWYSTVSSVHTAFWHLGQPDRHMLFSTQVHDRTELYLSLKTRSFLTPRKTLPY